MVLVLFFFFSGRRRHTSYWRDWSSAVSSSDLEGVRAAARGETVLAPPVAARLVSRLRAPAVDAPTARELEVLAGVARGLGRQRGGVGKRVGVGGRRIIKKKKNRE